MTIYDAVMKVLENEEEGLTLEQIYDKIMKIIIMNSIQKSHLILCASK